MWQSLCQQVSLHSHGIAGAATTALIKIKQFNSLLKASLEKAWLSKFFREALRSCWGSRSRMEGTGRLSGTWTGWWWPFRAEVSWIVWFWLMLLLLPRQFHSYANWLVDRLIGTLEYWLIWMFWTYGQTDKDDNKGQDRHSDQEN